MIIKPKRDAFFAVRIRFPDDAGRWILGIPDILSIPGHHDNCNKIELQCLVFVLKKDSIHLLPVRERGRQEARGILGILEMLGMPIRKIEKKREHFLKHLQVSVFQRLYATKTKQEDSYDSRNPIDAPSYK